MTVVPPSFCLEDGACKKRRKFGKWSFMRKIMTKRVPVLCPRREGGRLEPRGTWDRNKDIFEQGLDKFRQTVESQKKTLKTNRKKKTCGKNETFHYGGPFDKKALEQYTTLSQHLTSLVGMRITHLGCLVAYTIGLNMFEILSSMAGNIAARGGTRWAPPNWPTTETAA